MKHIFKKMPVALWLLGSLLFFTHAAVAQVQGLNSYPAAAAVIYLDFDGQTVQGTSWNANGALACAPANLSPAQITEIQNRVAEDYRPFNINVTTDSAKYWAAPAAQRIRIILTITSDWYGNVGGVSFNNSFTWGDNTPAFVFTALLNYNTKYIAEAAAHEAGHTLGLRHQAAYDDHCAKTSDYNYGKGDGEIGWAPIMGVGYYRNYTIWHNGSNPYGCSNKQDDLGIISGKTNGIGFRADDYDSTFTNAYTVKLNENQFSVNGVIATDWDKDMFRVDLDVTGRLQLAAIPFNVGDGDAGSNLDMQVKLYDANQQLIQTYNPADRLDATIDTLLQPGTYYYCISGAKNQYASEYASLGSYAVKGIVTPIPTTLTIKKLLLTGSIEQEQHQLNWVIETNEKILKQTLEVSNNGIDFQKVALLSKEDRSYSYTPDLKGRLQYRVDIEFTNNHKTFTNAVALINVASVAKPALVTNILYTDQASVIAPSAFAYSISDYAGRMIAGGKLTAGENHISTGNLTRGLYLIQYTNGTKQYTEKFIKQ